MTHVIVFVIGFLLGLFLPAILVFIESQRAIYEDDKSFDRIANCDFKPEDYYDLEESHEGPPNLDIHPFEVFQFIEPVSLQRLLREVPKDKLVYALKGASDAVKVNFMHNMSPRAGKMLYENMEAVGPIRLRDVDEAQKEILAIFQKLVEAGHAIPHDADEKWVK